MTYQVLARKWRPQNFIDMVGQDHISSTLCNAIKNNRVGHAYLFVGTRGTGKTTTARIFAKAINCENPLPDANPCDKCTNCLEITAGSCMDVLEIDGASNNGVEDIRRLRENVQYTPARCSYKIYIIDEVHMLSTAAWNALLKTLEEPPSHVKFFFATTEAHKVLPTILSRCQRFDLKRISQGTISRRLQEIAIKEKAQFDQSALNAIARAANGGMRDALSIMDQMIAFCSDLDTISEHDVSEVFGLTSNNDLAKITLSLLNNDAAQLINEINRLADIGRNLEQLYADLLQFTRNLMICAISGNQAKDILDLDEHELKLTREIVQQVNQDTLQRLVDGYLSHDGKIKNTLNKRVFLEMTLIRIMKDAHAASLNDILKRLNALRKAGTLNEIETDTPQQKVSISLPQEEKKKITITEPQPEAAPKVEEQTVLEESQSTSEAKEPETKVQITPPDETTPLEPITQTTEPTPREETIPQVEAETILPKEPIEPKVSTPDANDRPDYLNQMPSSITMASPENPEIKPSEYQEAASPEVEEAITQPAETENIQNTDDISQDKTPKFNQPEAHRSVNPLLDTLSVEKIIVDDSLELPYSTLIDEEYIKAARGKDPLQLGLQKYQQDFDENNETPGSALGVYYLKNANEDLQVTSPEQAQQVSKENTQPIEAMAPQRAEESKEATTPNTIQEAKSEEPQSLPPEPENLEPSITEGNSSAIETSADSLPQEEPPEQESYETPQEPSTPPAKEPSQPPVSPEDITQQLWEQCRALFNQETPEIQNQLLALTPISCNASTFIFSTEDPELTLTPSLEESLTSILHKTDPSSQREVKLVKAVANSTDQDKKLTSGDEVWKRVNEAPFFKQICAEFDGTIIDVRG